MKLTKLLLAGLLVMGTIACDKKSEPKRVLDTNAKLSIHVTNSDGSRAKGTYAKDRDEFMERVNTILGKDDSYNKDRPWNYTITEEMKDYPNHIVKMWGDAIIIPRREGVRETETLNFGFIGAHDVVFTDDRTPRDTLGYIPNSVLRDAEAKIRVAFDAGDYDKVYKLFNEVYQAIPITGKEWQALKAQGKQ